jgi:hypothetical protein
LISIDSESHSGISFPDAGVTLFRNWHQMAIRIWNFEFRAKMAPNLVNSQWTGGTFYNHRKVTWRLRDLGSNASYSQYDVV